MTITDTKQQNLKLLMRLTLINILNAKGVIYTYYKQQEREGYEKQGNKLFKNLYIGR